MRKNQIKQRCKALKLNKQGLQDFTPMTDFPDESEVRQATHYITRNFKVGKAINKDLPIKKIKDMVEKQSLGTISEGAIILSMIYAGFEHNEGCFNILKPKKSK